MNIFRWKLYLSFVSVRNVHQIVIVIAKQYSIHIRIMGSYRNYKFEVSHSMHLGFEQILQRIAAAITKQ